MLSNTIKISHGRLDIIFDLDIRADSIEGRLNQLKHSPGSDRGNKALSSAGGRVVLRSLRLLPEGAPLDIRDWQFFDRCLSSQLGLDAF